MTDPVLKAALAGEHVAIFGAIEMQLPGHTLRLLDGSGELVIEGQLYTGIDPVFGVLDSIGTHEEAIGDEAPTLTIGLLPPDASAAATLASALMQGSRVRIMMGVYDPATMTVVGVPEQLFLGEVDVPTFEIGEGGQRTVSYTVVSVFERLFEVREGERASDGWHQSIWPGEKGLEYMTGTDKNLYWMAKRLVPQYIGSGNYWNYNPNTPNPAWEGAQ